MDGDGVFVVGQENKSSITQNNADVVAWSHAHGAYGGINVEGASISFDDGATAKYYGQPLTPDQVFERRRAQSGRRPVEESARGRQVT